MCEESLKTTLLATHFNMYLNLEASLHSIITVICINQVGGGGGRDEVWDRETMFLQLAKPSPSVVVSG